MYNSFTREDNNDDRHFYSLPIPERLTKYSELARRCKLARTTISKMLRCKCGYSARSVREIALAAGCSTSFVVGYITEVARLKSEADNG